VNQPANRSRIVTLAAWALGCLLANSVWAQNDAVSDEVAERVIDATEARIEAELEEWLDEIEQNMVDDQWRIDTGHWLVMAEPAAFERLAEEGYLFDTFTELPELGLQLAQVAAPASFDISTTRAGILDVVGGGQAEVDLNHLYTAGSPVAADASEGVDPRDVAVQPELLATLDTRIGIIDSAVDTTHQALSRARIRHRAFAEDVEALPQFHGTAIASIFAGEDADFHGLAPLAQLYSAAVFSRDPKLGEIASTVSLVKALDWLLAEQVEVINLSLAGPPNRLLEVALERVGKRGVMVFAAAGNGGPMAKPMYPAAYDSVVAVTAVDTRNRAFRLANRGAYVDIAAPGVNVRHAAPGGGFSVSSGTSFAVPFATVAAAYLRREATPELVLDRIYAAATDIGPPGRDDIYGYGLLAL
jgi:subtilisin family serine protease